jgi:hypothetical protein
MRRADRGSATLWIIYLPAEPLTTPSIGTLSAEGEPRPARDRRVLRETAALSAGNSRVRLYPSSARGGILRTDLALEPTLTRRLPTGGYLCGS